MRAGHRFNSATMGGDVDQRAGKRARPRSRTETARSHANRETLLCSFRGAFSSIDAAIAARNLRRSLQHQDRQLPGAVKLHRVVMSVLPELRDSKADLATIRAGEATARDKRTAGEIPTRHALARLIDDRPHSWTVDLPSATPLWLRRTGIARPCAPKEDRTDENEPTRLA
jgi:hypothetical protein